MRRTRTMRQTAASALLLVAGAFLAPSAHAGDEKGKVSSIANPAIDMKGYLEVSREAAKHRESHRLSEEAFLAMMSEPGTIVLDARSREKYAELHVKGAINLPFPDIAVESLKRALPDASARILIYCNNNFSNAEGPFPAKAANASLNISTYISLYSYGYRNVFELGPKVDIASSKLPFEGSRR